MYPAACQADSETINNGRGTDLLKNDPGWSERRWIVIKVNKSPAKRQEKFLPDSYPKLYGLSLTPSLPGGRGLCAKRRVRTTFPNMV